MKYNIDVVICNPNTPKGMNSEICLALTAEFEYDPNQYGTNTLQRYTAKGSANKPTVSVMTAHSDATTKKNGSKAGRVHTGTAKTERIPSNVSRQKRFKYESCAIGYTGRKETP